jgi:5-methyltetrahydropteroyltriglutamate--homocysteine methyltransferase
MIKKQQEDFGHSLILVHPICHCSSDGFERTMGMQTSSERILTTHTGSLPRPADLTDRRDDAEVRAAVEETVSRQRAAGVDIVNDGEVSKPSYATYVTERMTGFDGEPATRTWSGRELEDFPEYYERLRAQTGGVATPPCTGPVGYTDAGRARLAVDIANIKAATGFTASASGASGSGASAAASGDDVFMSAASPGIIAGYMPDNQYYASTEEYIFALADAMKEEYDAIVAAGLILQLDCPDLPGSETSLDDATEDEVAEFRKGVAMRLAAVDHATRDIPPDRMRMHLCWGNGEGPHHTDVPLARFVDLVLAARAGAISFEGANPRHEHEWVLWEDVKLPDGKVIIPGVLDSTTNFIEHPELVAQRIARYADVVGKENVIAGTDCGFATIAGMHTVDPRITWAKLAAMAEGARLASGRLWGR